MNKLLEFGVKIDAQNKFGHTAFTVASASGNSEMVRLLMFHGANPYHQTLEGRTALHYACKYAKAKTVKTIISFLLEQFATFRINPQNHLQSDFDFTRWSKYTKILRDFIYVR